MFFERKFRQLTEIFSFVLAFPPQGMLPELSPQKTNPPTLNFQKWKEGAVRVFRGKPTFADYVAIFPLVVMGD